MKEYSLKTTILHVVQGSFTVDVLDDADYSTEENATLAEVPQRRFVNDVLLG